MDNRKLNFKMTLEIFTPIYRLGVRIFSWDLPNYVQVIKKNPLAGESPALF
jgi:hypothetical protein